MEQTDKFRPGVILCIKCGYDIVGRTFCEGEAWSIWNRNPCQLYDSHLHCRCQACEARWTRPSLDVEEPLTDSPAESEARYLTTGEPCLCGMCSAVRAKEHPHG